MGVYFSGTGSDRFEQVLGGDRITLPRTSRQGQGLGASPGPRGYEQEETDDHDQENWLSPRAPFFWVDLSHLWVLVIAFLRPKAAKQR